MESLNENKVCKIYSIMSIDSCNELPIEPDVVQSTRSRETAVNACTEYILERIHLRPDIRYAMMHDMDHEELADVVAGESGVSRDEIRDSFKYSFDEGWNLPEKVMDALSKFVHDALSVESAYIISTDMDSDVGSEVYTFMIVENQLTN